MSSEGEQPPSAEKELGLFEGVSQGSTHFDLHFMEQRLVAVHAFKKSSSGYAAGGGLVGALIGEGIEHLRESKWKQKQESMKEMTLDERVASDKKSFWVSYSDVVHADLVKRTLGAKYLQLKINDGKDKWEERFELPTKEAFEKAFSLLPTISGLAGKLELPM